jgi:multicomponent Na+:H+ antiporter subunit B
MIEIYLRLVDRALTPVIVVVAIILFLRGHDYPGGGFIAGLTVAAAIELQILAQGATPVRERFGRYLLPLVGLGLFTAVSAALLGMYQGGFFKGIWLKFSILNAEIKVGTPQLFDLGVMLVVIGMTVTYLLRLTEASEQRGNDVFDGEQQLEEVDA